MSNKKKIALGILVVLLTFGSGVGVGRFAAPTKVTTVKEERVIERQTQVVQQTIDKKELAELFKITAKRNDVVVLRETIRAKDGTVTIKERREDKSTTDTKATSKTDTQVAEKSNSKTDTSKDSYSKETRIVERLQPPTWSLSADVGANPLAALQLKSPSPNPLGLPYTTMVGVGVERRLFGGLSGGIWANTRGDAGLRLRISW